MEYKRSRFGKKRGVESIVGGFFFLILLLGGFAAILTALSVQTNLFNTQISASNKVVGKAQETFSVQASVNTGSNNRLNVFVNNLGTNPVQAADLFITNHNSPYSVNQYSINYADSFVAAGTTGNITNTQPINLVSPTFPSPGTYDIKVVSALGTMQKTTISMPYSPLNVQFYTVNKSIATGDNVTMVMVITNNGTTDLTNVSPTIPKANPTALFSGSVVPSTTTTIKTLKAGNSVVLTWYAIMVGGVGSFGTVSSTVTGSNPDGSTVSQAVSTKVFVNYLIQNIKISATRTTPQISLIVPYPMGSDNTFQSAFGVVVSNPTDAPVTINQVVINLITVASNSNGKVQYPLGGAFTQITPTSGWAVLSGGQGQDYALQWTGTTTVAARASTSFIVAAQDLAPPADLLDITLGAVVFTNVGELTKIGYATSLALPTATLSNTYATASPPTTTGATVANSDIVGHINGWKSTDSTDTLYFTLANWDTGGTQQINTGAGLSIYVPAGFVVQKSQLDKTSRFNTPVLSNFTDGSQLIAARLNSAISGITNVEYVKVVVAPPNVLDDRIYIFYSSSNGTASRSGGGNINLGATAEIPVQVCPTTGSPPNGC